MYVAEHLPLPSRVDPEATARRAAPPPARALPQHHVTKIRDWLFAVREPVSSRPPVSCGAAANLKRRVTDEAKDRERKKHKLGQKRAGGSAEFSRWKSDEEMRLRQHFD